MMAPELVRTVEEAGGRFTFDTSEAEEVIVRFDLGIAPERLLPLLERNKIAVVSYLLRRWFLESWRPVLREHVQ